MEGGGGKCRRGTCTIYKHNKSMHNIGGLDCAFCWQPKPKIMIFMRSILCSMPRNNVKAGFHTKILRQHRIINNDYICFFLCFYLCWNIKCRLNCFFCCLPKYIFLNNNLIMEKFWVVFLRCLYLCNEFFLFPNLCKDIENKFGYFDGKTPKIFMNNVNINSISFSLSLSLFLCFFMLMKRKIIGDWWGWGGDLKIIHVLYAMKVISTYVYKESMRYLRKTLNFLNMPMLQIC